MENVPLIPLLLIGLMLYEAFKAVKEKHWSGVGVFLSMAIGWPLGVFIGWLVGDENSNLVWLGLMPLVLCSIWLFFDFLRHMKERSVEIYALYDEDK